MTSLSNYDAECSDILYPKPEVGQSDSGKESLDRESKESICIEKEKTEALEQSAEKKGGKNFSVPLHNSNLEQLEDEENALAMKLRLLCTSHGKESSETLEDSAEALVFLGVVYLRKAIVQTGSEQKLSYIRCAVLVHAAIERFKIMENPEKILLANQVCQEMSENVLWSCGSNCKVNFLEISEEVFKLVQEKRNEIQKILDTDLCRNEENDPTFGAKKDISEKLRTIGNIEILEKISLYEIEKILSPDKEKKEKRITEKVHEINKDVTAFYREIMCSITSECLKFLPSQPCKFSIAGLGSVAREEATLYSDFEHVILLEEGIDEKENYESVLEYFRWFSVVFQVIVIGFGETIIPSVAVKSLNDSYSENPEANWFYDDFTPSGISFDGMVPHACKIPIGRQQQTKKRAHTIELIKTPQKMAEYLTQNEQLKNGYHLDDVLRQTCLVYGDSDIYDSFIEERDCILEGDAKEFQLLYSEMILKNTVPYVRRMFQVARTRIFNSKSYFYRPIAINIVVLARMYKVEVASTFDIIDTLHERGILGSKTYHKLKYAFAVACEVRMKLYHKENDQRHAIEKSDIEELVGEKTLVDCNGVLWMLQASMKNYVYENGITEALEITQKKLTSYSPSDVIYDLLQRGYPEEVVSVCEKICELTEYEEEEEEQIQFTLAIMFDCYIKYGKECSNVEQRQEYFKKIEVMHSKIEGRRFLIGLPITLTIELDMARFYRLMNKDHESIDTFETYFMIYFCDEQDEDEDKKFIGAYIEYYELVRWNLSMEEADKRLETVLWDDLDKLESQLFTEMRLMQRYHLAESALHNRVKSCDNTVTSGNFADISEEFQSISSDILKHGRKMIFPMILQSWIARVQIKMGQNEDAIDTLDATISLHAARSDVLLYNTEQTFIHMIESMKRHMIGRGEISNQERMITNTDLQELRDIWEDT